MNTENQQPNRGGRKPKTNPCSHRYSVRLNDADNAAFLSKFEQSGLQTKAHFIAACIFNKQLKVVKIDKTAFDYYVKLTELYGQFRAVGVNYNQTVKAVKAIFTEKKALAFLYKLEKATKELIETNQQIIALTEAFYLKKIE